MSIKVSSVVLSAKNGFAKGCHGSHGFVRGNARILSKVLTNGITTEIKPISESGKSEIVVTISSRQLRAELIGEIDISIGSINIHTTNIIELRSYLRKKKFGVAGYQIEYTHTSTASRRRQLTEEETKNLDKVLKKPPEPSQALIDLMRGRLGRHRLEKK